jgi:hypothetical protein
MRRTSRVSFPERDPNATRIGFYCLVYKRDDDAKI